MRKNVLTSFLSLATIPEVMNLQKRVYSDSPVQFTTVSRLLWERARLSSNPSGERKTVPRAGGEARSEEGTEGVRTHEVTSFLRDPPLKASSAFQLL